MERRGVPESFLMKQDNWPRIVPLARIRRNMRKGQARKARAAIFLLTILTDPLFTILPAVAPQRTAISHGLRPEGHPSAPEILEKYVKACGGRQAISRITSRACKGRTTYPDGSIELFEIYLKAPDKWLAIYNTARGVERYGFDGSIGWFDAPQPNISKLPREVDLYTPLRMKDWYPDMKFIGTAKVGERTAYITEGSWKNRPPDRYYFDAQTGLLLRQDERARASVARGSDPKTQEASTRVVEYYFSDYRSVGGVKLPFVVRRKDAAGIRTEIFHEIRHDAAIPDSKFQR